MPKTKTYHGWLVGVLLAGVLLMLHSPVKIKSRKTKVRRIRTKAIRIRPAAWRA